MFTQITEFLANNPLLAAAFVGLLVAIVFNELKTFGQKFSRLTPATLVQLMNNDENLVLLDVREPGETVNGKIAKAIQIPVGSVAKRVAELEKHKDKSIAVYCKTGQRSSIACSALNKNGFEKVYNLTGGILAWQEAHMPIVKK